MLVSKPPLIAVGLSAKARSGAWSSARRWARKAEARSGGDVPAPLDVLAPSPYPLPDGGEGRGPRKNGERRVRMKA
jgi:hypothetical protein